MTVVACLTEPQPWACPSRRFPVIVTIAMVNIEQTAAPVIGETR